MEAGSERAGETPVQEKSELLIIVNHTHPQALTVCVTLVQVHNIYTSV